MSHLGPCPQSCGPAGPRYTQTPLGSPPSGARPTPRLPWDAALHFHDLNDMHVDSRLVLLLVPWSPRPCGYFSSL